MSDYNPKCDEISVNGSREIALRTKHFSKRRLFINGDIDEDTARHFMYEYMYLVEESNLPIDIYINSPGGSVSDGLVIIDLIESSPVEIRTIACGMAASMASVILASGHKRYILPHSKVMIHEPRISSGSATKSATDIEEVAKRILETKQVVNEIISKKCNKTIVEINEKTKRDCFMNSNEAIEFGIVDEIISGPFIKGGDV